MEYFYKFQRLNDEYKIVTKKNNDETYINDTFIKFDNLKNQIKQTQNENISYLYINLYIHNRDLVPYLYKLFNINNKEAYSLLNKEDKNIFYLYKWYYNHKLENIDPNNKVNTVFYNNQSGVVYHKIKDLPYCKRESLLYTNRIDAILQLFNCLEIGGTFYITSYGYCDSRTIELLYILSFMFEYIVIYKSFNIFCYNFNPVITARHVKKLLSKHNSIEPKHGYDKLMKYLNNSVKYDIDTFNLILKQNEDEVILKTFNETLALVKYINPDLINDFLISHNLNLMKYFKRLYIDKQIVKTTSGINNAEGNTISTIIQENNFKTCLEIGMAYGLSSFYILMNKNTSLISIDPYQTSQWNNNGVKLLTQFKFIKRHKLYKETNYVALPKILSKYKANYFDFIFIDGFHTFDYTLFDFFYSNFLLKIGGIIIIDDALHYGVNKCIKYIETNYLSYTKLISSPTIAIFKKKSEDNRIWSFHKNF